MWIIHLYSYQIRYPSANSLTLNLAFSNTKNQPQKIQSELHVRKLIPFRTAHSKLITKLIYISLSLRICYAKHFCTIHTNTGDCQWIATKYYIKWLSTIIVNAGYMYLYASLHFVFSLFIVCTWATTNQTTTQEHHQLTRFIIMAFHGHSDTSSTFCVVRRNDNSNCICAATSYNPSGKRQRVAWK